ncbi:hypothetical protein CERSUDRAFT_77818 [Gelatoporia subvermispora B]|uniref:Uncharacterized protein n=1 Tax=Ceriporiopsis subvermispora (strain B) TaxID=914234 RepID=M2QIS1_CERS8|nr:hypothetical protein CERSUDRAFT_77818 [Gelatoporia subvermispora B]
MPDASTLAPRCNTGYMLAQGTAIVSTIAGLLAHRRRNGKITEVKLEAMPLHCKHRGQGIAWWHTGCYKTSEADRNMVGVPVLLCQNAVHGKLRIDTINLHQRGSETEWCINTLLPLVGQSRLNNSLYIFGRPVPKKQPCEAHKAFLKLPKYQCAVRLRTQQQRLLMHMFRKGLVCRTPEVEALQEEQHPGSVINAGQPKVKVCYDTGDLPEGEKHQDWNTGAPEKLGIAVKECLTPEQHQLGVRGTAGHMTTHHKGLGPTDPPKPYMNLIGVKHGFVLDFRMKQYTSGVVSFKHLCNGRQRRVQVEGRGNGDHWDHYRWVVIVGALGGCWKGRLYNKVTGKSVMGAGLYYYILEGWDNISTPGAQPADILHKGQQICDRYPEHEKTCCTGKQGRTRGRGAEQWFQRQATQFTMQRCGSNMKQQFQ